MAQDILMVVGMIAAFWAGYAFASEAGYDPEALPMTYERRAMLIAAERRNHV